MALAHRLVYVVDDDKDVRDSTITLLKAAGITSKGCASGAEFLQDIESFSALGGCLLLDLHMDGQSGFEVLDALQERKSTVPVIVFSGRVDTVPADLTRRPGIAAILQKPTAAAELVALVRRLLSPTRATP